jgi:tRNA-2-methylthio-N6-dimethylallyladenosine synthase
VDRLRAACPDIALTTDLIVGFPGETAAEVEETLSLTESVRFDAAFTFIYSPRPGTRAAALEDATPMAEKTARIERLIALQGAEPAEILAAQVGTVANGAGRGASARNPRLDLRQGPIAATCQFPGNIESVGRMCGEDRLGGPQYSARSAVDGGYQNEQVFLKTRELGRRDHAVE